MITQARVFQLIRNTLVNDSQSAAKAPGGIYQTLAPASGLSTTSTPWVVYAQQSPLRDIQARGGQLVMGRGLITVQAVGPATGGQAIQDAADWIDSLLNTLQQVAVAGSTVIRIVRDRELAYDELVQPAGVLWTHMGFIYQWWAQ